MKCLAIKLLKDETSTQKLQSLTDGKYVSLYYTEAPGVVRDGKGSEAAGCVSLRSGRWLHEAIYMGFCFLCVNCWINQYF